MKTTTEQNKGLVLEPFDTLFNRRDYAAAEKFWSTIGEWVRVHTGTFEGRTMK